MWKLDLGASVENGRVKFKIWAPYHQTVEVQIVDKQRYAMEPSEEGYFIFDTDQVKAGERYFYVINGDLLRPDPVSRSLPEGVHGPTEIIDPRSFKWDDLEWKGIDLRKCLFYEIHVGTFTKEGTFESALHKLDYLAELGITCVEVMPIAEFTGRWNWGYDGASLYSPYRGYGGVQGFKKFINACHKRGIAVCLDVVYNHLGPEGNYLEAYGPYFSSTYHTPWGKALNYDGAYSGQVRDFVINNALYWLAEYHVDMLRLDAIHGIYDFCARPMLLELAEAVQGLSQELGKKLHVIAESDLNDSRVIRPSNQWGLGLTGLWADDFHHAAHVALTGEQQWYYQDFKGVQDVAKVMTRAMVYEGQYSAFRKRKHGNSFHALALDRYIVFTQNHDQVGNRPFGERLGALVSKESLKIAACMAILSPSVPLLFMGEDYGETAPFTYFVDYDNESLMDSIVKGRKREFDREDMPFPGEESFLNSKLKWDIDPEIRSLYFKLIALRKKYLPKENIAEHETNSAFDSDKNWVAWEYLTEKDEWIGVLCYLGKEPIHIHSPFKHVQGKTLLLSTAEVIQEKETVWKLPFQCALVLM